MQKPGTDRRVQKTREALRGALLALLAERGWDGIDIQALCERANIGRSTFYLHYDDKGALLRGAFDDLRRHVLALGDPRARYPFLRGLLDHVHEQQDVFRTLLGRRAGQPVQDQFRDLLVRLFSEGAPAGAGWPQQALAQARAGALFQLLAWWLGERQPLAAADVEAWFLVFAGDG